MNFSLTETDNELVFNFTKKEENFTDVSVVNLSHEQACRVIKLALNIIDTISGAIQL